MFLNILKHFKKDKFEEANQPKSLPEFKYFKDPYGFGSFVASDKTCICCKQIKGYIYTGSFFSFKHEVNEFCPWCVHNGKAAKKFDGAFNAEILYANYTEVKDKQNLKIAGERTPSIYTWQELDWPVRDGDLCRFIDSIGWEEIQKLPEITILELKQRLKKEYNLSSDEQLQGLLQSIAKDGHHCGYLFQSIPTGVYVVYEDWD